MADSMEKITSTTFAGLLFQGDPKNKSWIPIIEAPVIISLQQLRGVWFIVAKQKESVVWEMRLEAGFKHRVRDDFVQFQKRSEELTVVTYGLRLKTPTFAKQMGELLKQVVTRSSGKSQPPLSSMHSDDVVLKVFIPGKDSTNVCVPDSATVSQVLKSVCQRRDLDPAGFVVTLPPNTPSGQPIQVKGQTTVGELSTNEIHLAKRRKTKQESPTPADSQELPMLLLQVELPKDERTVVRISPSITMAALLTYICEKRNIPVASHAFDLPATPESLAKKTLKELKINTIKVVCTAPDGAERSPISSPSHDRKQTKRRNAPPPPKQQTQSAATPPEIMKKLADEFTARGSNDVDLVAQSKRRMTIGSKPHRAAPPPVANKPRRRKPIGSTRSASSFDETDFSEAPSLQQSPGEIRHSSDGVPGQRSNTISSYHMTSEQSHVTKPRPILVPVNLPENDDDTEAPKEKMPVDKGKTLPGRTKPKGPAPRPPKSYSLHRASKLKALSQSRESVDSNLSNNEQSQSKDSLNSQSPKRSPGRRRKRPSRPAPIAPQAIPNETQEQVLSFEKSPSPVAAASHDPQAGSHEQKPKSHDKAVAVCQDTEDGGKVLIVQPSPQNRRKANVPASLVFKLPPPPPKKTDEPKKEENKMKKVDVQDSTQAETEGLYEDKDLDEALKELDGILSDDGVSTDPDIGREDENYTEEMASLTFPSVSPEGDEINDDTILSNEYTNLDDTESSEGDLSTSGSTSKKNSQDTSVLNQNGVDTDSATDSDTGYDVTILGDQLPRAVKGISLPPMATLVGSGDNHVILNTLNSNNNNSNEEISIPIVPPPPSEFQFQKSDSNSADSDVPDGDQSTVSNEDAQIVLKSYKPSEHTVDFYAMGSDNTEKSKIDNSPLQQEMVNKNDEKISDSNSSSPKETAVSPDQGLQVPEGWTTNPLSPGSLQDLDTVVSDLRELLNKEDDRAERASLFEGPKTIEANVVQVGSDRSVPKLAQLTQVEQSSGPQATNVAIGTTTDQVTTKPSSSEKEGQALPTVSDKAQTSPKSLKKSPIPAKPQPPSTIANPVKMTSLELIQRIKQQQAEIKAREEEMKARETKAKEEEIAKAQKEAEIKAREEEAKAQEAKAREEEIARAQQEAEVKAREEEMAKLQKEAQIKQQEAEMKAREEEIAKAQKEADIVTTVVESLMNNKAIDSQAEIPSTLVVSTIGQVSSVSEPTPIAPSVQEQPDPPQPLTVSTPAIVSSAPELLQQPSVETSASMPAPSVAESQPSSSVIQHPSVANVSAGFLAQNPSVNPVNPIAGNAPSVNSQTSSVNPLVGSLPQIPFVNPIANNASLQASLPNPIAGNLSLVNSSPSVISPVPSVNPMAGNIPPSNPIAGIGAAAQQLPQLPNPASETNTAVQAQLQFLQQQVLQQQMMQLQQQFQQLQSITMQSPNTGMGMPHGMGTGQFIPPGANPLLYAQMMGQYQMPTGYMTPPMYASPVPGYASPAPHPSMMSQLPTAPGQMPLHNTPMQMPPAQFQTHTPLVQNQSPVQQPQAVNLQPRNSTETPPPPPPMGPPPTLPLSTSSPVLLRKASLETRARALGDMEDTFDALMGEVRENNPTLRRVAGDDSGSRDSRSESPQGMAAALEEAMRQRRQHFDDSRRSRDFEEPSFGDWQSP